MISKADNMLKMTDPLYRRSIDRNFNNIIIALTVVIFIGPIILDLMVNGWKRVFFYLAADVFYYLTVARNFATSGFFSFDSKYITNGFQPIWQVSSGLVYKLAKTVGLGDQVVLVCILTLCLILIAFSIILLGNSIARIRGNLSVWFIALPVGVYPVLLMPFERRFGTLWSFTNGMETAILLFTYTLMIWMWLRRDVLENLISSIQFGLVLSILFLSRLDHGLIVIVVLGYLGIELVLHRRFAKMKYLFITGAIFTSVLFIYIITNFFTAGSILPISGSIKTTFPFIYAGKEKIKEIPIILSQFGQPGFGPLIWRYTQMIFPVIFSIAVISIYAGKINKSKLTSLDQVWIITGIFVILLGAYNFLFVPTNDQGHWYYPVSILYMTIVTIDWFGVKSRKKDPLMVLIIIISVMLFYLFVYHTDTHNDRYRLIYEERPRILKHYRGKIPQIVEYDDGIIAYTTGFPSMSGFGFCLDKEAGEAMTEGHLLDIAYERKFRYIASLNYFRFGLSPESTPESIKKYLQSISSFIGQSDLSKYKFQIDYSSDATNLLIIKMRKIQ
jgi:hypothetical protein